MKSFIIVLLLCVIGGTKVFAQGVTFTASAPSVVEVGEQFRLSYMLNKQGENLHVPTLKDFNLLAGPSLSTSFKMSSINGQVTQNSEYTYTYVIEGTEEGEYTIEPATITVDGKEYKSNAIKIKVIKGLGKPQGGNAAHSDADEATTTNSISEDNLFIRMEVSRNSLYVGESLTATLKVYARVNLVDIQGKKIPPFDGFLTEDVKIPQIKLEREEHNGKIYDRVGVLQKTILFPQHAGVLTIDPYELICVVRQRAGRSNSMFDDFFGNSRDVRVLCKSKPVKITVKNLPEAGKPLGFSGMVGNLSMTTSISPETLKTNDALTYKIVFRGSGNLKLLEAPKITFPHDFDVYDPKVTKNIESTGTSGTVTCEYLVIPRYAGDYNIPAVQFSFFDPTTGTYKMLKGEDYTIHVEKGNDTGTGTGAAALQSFKKEDVRVLGQDIRFIKTDNSQLRPKGVLYFGSSAYWLSFIIPFILFVIGMILNRRRIKANSDLVRVKSKTANKRAQKRLKAAEVAMKAGNSELFYQEILNAMWGYMSYKLNIVASELNRDNISDHLARRGVDAALMQNFIEILDHCEYARYAPDANQGEEMDKVYQDSITVITKLDKAI